MHGRGSPAAPETRMIPANLIINADDFGLDLRISRDIHRCIREKLINSISVLPFRDREHEDLLGTIAAEHPEVRIGAHLSLIETEPVLAETPRFAPDRSSASSYREFLGMYLRRRIRPSHIRAEWRAQVALLGGRLGGVGRIAHLDSHQHVHVLPGIWKVACAIREEAGIPRLRVPYESLTRAAGYRFPFGLGFQALSLLRRSSGTGRFLGFFTSTRFTLAGNLPGLDEVLRRPHLGYELMVHPGQAPDGGLSDDPENVAAEGPWLSGHEMEELRRLQAYFEESGRKTGSATGSRER